MVIGGSSERLSRAKTGASCWLQSMKMVLTGAMPLHFGSCYLASLGTMEEVNGRIQGQGRGCYRREPRDPPRHCGGIRARGRPDRACLFFRAKSHGGSERGCRSGCAAGDGGGRSAHACGLRATVPPCEREVRPLRRPCEQRRCHARR